jgi:hypothetical protein
VVYFTYQEAIVTVEMIFVDKESKCPKTIVQSDNDNIMVLCKIHTIIVPTPALHGLGEKYYIHTITGPV